VVLHRRRRPELEGDLQPGEHPVLAASRDRQRQITDPDAAGWLKYDVIFNGAMAARMPKSSPGQYAGEDNGWVLSLVYPVLIEFDQSIIKYPNIKRFPGGARSAGPPPMHR
jgi:hypothetical protein